MLMRVPEINHPHPANHADVASSLYETDFYAWTQEQARLLRQQQWHYIDLANLIEEIESLGKQQRQELRNRLSVLLGHLLKWHLQPQQRSRSWLATIRIQRLDMAELLEDNPSLQPDVSAIIQKAYPKAAELAASETDLPRSTFPAACPYSLEDMLAPDFFPGEPSDLLNE
jgi:hypothetical protein